MLNEEGGVSSSKPPGGVSGSKPPGGVSGCKPPGGVSDACRLDISGDGDSGTRSEKATILLSSSITMCR